MKTKTKSKARLLMAVSAFIAVIGVGFLLDHAGEERFVIETVPPHDSTDSATGAAQTDIDVVKSNPENTNETVAKAETITDNGEMVIDGKVNINTANAEVLDKLDGVGESVAQRIIDYREAHGPFENIEELTLVNGIGQKKLDSLRDYICVK